MNASANTGELFDTAASVLIRCFLLGILLLLVWGVLILFAGEYVYCLHYTLIPITRQQFYAIHYAGMAFTKITICLLFLLPYLGIKLAAKKQ